MKILNRTEFLESPTGTLFQKFEEYNVQELCVFLHKCENVDDFIYKPISGLSLNNANDDEFIKLADLARSEDIPICFDDTCRDGYFDKDQMFLVWSSADVKNLRDVLS